MYLETAVKDIKCDVCGRDIPEGHDYMLDHKDLVPTYCLWCGTQKITDKVNMNKVFPISMIKKILREQKQRVQKIIEDVVDNI